MFLQVSFEMLEVETGFLLNALVFLQVNMKIVLFPVVRKKKSFVMLLCNVSIFLIYLTYGARLHADFCLFSCFSILITRTDSVWVLRS